MSAQTPEGYELIYLADAPHYIETCAAWHFTAWGIKSDQRTLQKDIKKFEASANKNSVPFTILYREKSRNVPVAMGSVWENDSAYWSKLNPWITGVFVHEDFRGRGLAKSIMQQLEDDARRMGLATVYLTASAAVGLYEKLEYTAVEARNAPETPTGRQTLFSKDLQS
jgi:N-acetylglutamate synthase-like GNAT family acetyltransferase